MTEETVTITKARYDRLVRNSKLLSALEEGGVDNWEWYSEAYRQAFPEELDES